MFTVSSQHCEANVEDPEVYLKILNNYIYTLRIQ